MSTSHTRLEPQFITFLRHGYSRSEFLRDLTAGLIVGIVALPLAIAFAIASGVKPEQGLYTAIIAGLTVSLLGGSRVQIAGPTGAFIVIIYGVVQKHGYDGLAAATLIAGVLLILMGIARLGTLLRFIPYPLTVGFTSGIALIIFSSQVKDLLGLPMPALPADFVGKWWEYAHHFSGAHLPSVLVGAGSLVLILLWPKVTHKIPGPLVAILAATAAVHLFDIPVDTIGTRFGSVPSSLPSPRLPDVSWVTITELFSPALAIALLGGIESLLSAVVADGMTRTRHRSNMELVGQGVANVLSPIFLGIPATGAIARTATNIKSGGRTPVAGIVHALVLLVIMLLFGRWAALIPMPALAAILVVVAYNMSEWHSFLKLLRAPREDVAVLLVTFALTVFIDLTVALEFGVILAALLFMRKMAQISQVNPITKDLREEAEEEDEGARPTIPDDVEVFEVYGTLFFGAVEQFTESIRFLEKKPRAFILDTHRLLAVDATGLRALDDLAAILKSQGTALVISGIHKQPLVALTQSGFIDRIGEENICGSLEEALERVTRPPD
jgi:sulfate permease, SulP family